MIDQHFPLHNYFLVVMVTFVVVMTLVDDHEVGSTLMGFVDWNGLALIGAIVEDYEHLERGIA